MFWRRHQACKMFPVGGVGAARIGGTGRLHVAAGPIGEVPEMGRQAGVGVRKREGSGSTERSQVTACGEPRKYSSIEGLFPVRGA